MRNAASIFGMAVFAAAQIVLYLWVGPAGVMDLVQSVAAAAGWSYNTILVVLGASLLGMASGLIGSYAVLRRRSLVGDAVAHAALPGVAVAFLVLHERHFAVMLTGAAAAGLAGAWLIAWIQKNTRIKADAAIGIVLSVFYGAGIALSGIIQNDPSGRQAGLDSFLLGKTAGMISQDLIFIAGVALNIVVVTAGLSKEFKLLTFDSDFASVQGWPVLALDALMMGLLVSAVVIGLPAVGVVLMAALIILPGVSARFWTERLRIMLVLSAVFGFAIGGAGALVSARMSEFPAGATIVLTGAVIFVVSMLAAPRRGVIARAVRYIAMRRSFAELKWLSLMYELSGARVTERLPISADDLLAAAAWTRRELTAAAAVARKRGDAEAADVGWRLTEKGLCEAARVVKGRRLWEVFLAQYADVATDYADRDPRMLERALAPDILYELERILQRDGRWPEPARCVGRPIDDPTRVMV